ncbi:MAG TPA: FISUMP domain-containing protein, partial [Bacteroidales bacterium]|nr:FISUMP domain-containing protein [Bacteroidales bacterium]
MIKYINLFKLYLFISAALLASGAVAKAQYLISSTQKITYENDSVILHVDTVRGDVQWQVSEDKILWKNIDGETKDSLLIHVDSSAFYRAIITEGTCAPVFSDTVLIAQVYDDRDNRFYDAVKIGEQWWMAQNLDYSLPGGSWYYGNDSINHAEKYGRLYNWESAKAGCPADWHLPDDLEWKLLEMDLGMSKSQADSIEWRGTDQGTELQKQGKYHFNASLAGFRLANGAYNYIESSGTFWTSSEYDIGTAWYRGIGTEPDINRFYYDKEMGFSVRCIRNDPPVVYTDSVFDITTYTAIGRG